MNERGSTPDTGVTVVTVTRNRPHLIGRAIDSVAKQCCGHVAVHVVLVDDCSDTWQSLSGALPPTVHPRLIDRDSGEKTGPRRIAKLRDLGTGLARTKWVAYLDDDNQWEPTHLHSLLETAVVSGSPAVHSWARIFHSDGRVYLEQCDPWAYGEDNGRQEYRRLQGLGVVQPGSNVFKDRLDAHEGPTSVRSVDQSAWLLQTDLVKRIGFSNMRTAPDRTRGLAEDDLFNENLLAEGVDIRATGQATLRYYLGGYSTVPERNEPADW